MARPSDLTILYRIATDTNPTYIFRDRLHPGGGITPTTLTRLSADALIAVGEYEPTLGRRLTITAVGRAALIASLNTPQEH